MPELARFLGIVVRMYFSDADRRHKPHVHVEYGSQRASIGIDGELLAGSLPTKQFRLVSGWMALHEDELYEAWNNSVSGKALPEIEPLR
ncbi:MAG: DUF4160 domain-containing protein [Bifidobacteriaceae bacterium]|jgi:hypothetical protein|nr:DUF4160 domain-containing protein [Bifidobacteriaceae bacterium]